ncbi:IS3 family transposase [Clostridium botulinum]|uniref:IS3 family transposase n=4 Tax=Clostridium botulinum TaxID=1491 RepID=UPI0009946235|nr:IS3 family transposase [Clostridium botulinum]OOV62926.1 transposase [Clostridium botulinum D/C]
MSKITFSRETIEKLNRNPYVKRVSEKSITYSDEFKRMFIEKYLIGNKPRTIFIEAGFDVDVIGIKRYEQAAARWIRAYNKDGIVGLRDTRTENAGRPSSTPLSKDAIINKQEAKIKLLEEQLDLLKKFDMTERRLVNNCVNLTNNEVYELVFKTVSKKDYSGTVSYCCSILGVSRSGYYHYLKTAPARAKRENDDLKVRDIILKAYDYRGYKKGSRSIKMTLKNEFNITYSRKKIQRIMRKYSIVCPIRKANPYRRMAKATKEHRVVPNLLQRNFKQGIPGKILLTDITYIPYGINQMAYLSVIKDSSSNDILAYHVSDRITLDIATTTIYKLISLHKHTLHKDAFIHSDQGVHYTSPKFQKLLRENNLGQSMSRRGNCWDNAPQESFFGHMKDEVNFTSCFTLEDVINKIDDYIDYYNNHRCQWGLKKMTPKQFRNHLLDVA